MRMLRARHFRRQMMIYHHAFFERSRHRRPFRERRRDTIHLSVRLLRRVRYPRAGCPHGLTGILLDLLRPSPPPLG